MSQQQQHHHHQSQVATPSTTSTPSLTNSAMIETIKDVLASLVGSAACVYSGQPFDTIKVRLQVNPGNFEGTIPCIRNTIQNEGALALWRGSVPAFTGAIAENAVAFGTNGFLKRLLNFREDEETAPDEIRIIEPILAGGITGAVSALVLCPCDVLKCRAQVNVAHGANVQTMSQMTTHIFRNHGVSGMYRGFASQVLRDVPFYASFFGSYEIFCQMMKRHTTLEDPAIYFLAGGFAGQIGWASTIAFDTIKSQIQTSNAQQKLHITDVARSIYRKRGLGGFFLGIEVAVLRAFPANAALFMGYEYSRKLFDRVL